MRIEMEFLRSKVARRVFTLFVISALVPVLLLSLVSFQQVQSLLTEQKEEAVRQASKRYGLALLERLLILDTQLQWVADRLDARIAPPRGQQATAGSAGTTKGLRKIQMLTPADLEHPTSPLLERVGEMAIHEADYLANDKAILIAIPQPRLSARVYLLRAQGMAGAVPTYVLGEIDPDFLFGERDAFGSEAQPCVLSAERRPLFCTQAKPGLNPEELARLTNAASGYFETTDQLGRTELVSYWSIFLKPNFWVDEWIVLSRTPAAAVLETASHFRFLFPAVIALTLTVVALLSVHQIRRRLIPLECILDGVHRIARRDFSEPVAVESGDELEELATSVNQMAVTLEQQFQTLATMAELDQLILSSLKADDIVSTVLTRTGEILHQSHTSMTVMRGPTVAVCHTLARDAHGRESLEAQEIAIDPRETAALKTARHRISDLAADETPCYLFSLKALGARQVLTLAVLVKDEVHALISLGYESPLSLGREDIDLARDFANRVAVALSNARWEEQLYHLAHYDSLTQLPNRLLLKDRLHQILAGAERNDAYVAVFFIDLDRFKNVNDSLGHVTGDYLLREVGERLTRLLRDEDTVSRLGGDEFVVIIQHLRERREPLALTSSIAGQMLRELARPFQVNDREIITTASIGIACYPTDGDTPSELLKNADAAMYHAKARGKDNYQFYSKVLNAEALERLEMESALRQALARDEFQVFYQPKYEARSKRICGAEALLRWTHPERGRISPAQFIPICEEIGLILPIGEWVIRTVGAQIKEWIEHELPAIPVAINLSPVQFRQPNLIETVLKIIASQGLDPSLLEFEITEGAAMEDILATTATLGHFNALGFQLSIDDFGTGHSSLSYLKQFPIHTLKIDQSFVRHIGESAKDEAIVKSIITLAHSLSFSVVAEGVETLEQLDFLVALGCDVIQGYLFSPPISVEDFGKLLEKTA